MRAFLKDREGLTGLIILVFFGLVAIFAPLLADPDGLSVTKATGPQTGAPSLDYLFGTDNRGRSLLTLVIHGAQTTLLVGLAATVVSMLLGTLIGICAGHFGGFTGGALNRLTEWFLIIPYLPLAIVLATVFPPQVPRLVAVIVVIGVTSWSSTARLVRAQALAISARPYLERSRALGAGHWHQMTRHVLPNVMPLVLANTTLTVSIAIIAETTLSFLGLGDPLRVSWGRILDDAYSGGVISAGAWWWVAFPGLAVVLVVRAFNMCGRALERVLDPRGELS
ncbi:peptide/nickel transport system permease protein [Allocatelliglobosispora scoriae]|uniref:Peptide/nickel transport system permease protein n=1 Tax=Allocatelliglobosispora scoriae TaxID=643052 RepID=A0A841BTS7_9ACTN|nr:ABC transporter permease [Allocatelliglobosispora scoriae]MBB5870180.1 peptide/nickel transport system permease protein [Allocatelliglobosispora scoriae]